jgi:large conductance mechanosensitive channel
MIREFRDFIMRGNVVELAVAVVMAGAFGAVVTAFVEGLVTPLIAALFGQPDFSALDFEINDSVFRYGIVINALVSFILIAAAVFFFLVKPVNALMDRMRRRQEIEPTPDPAEIILLREIRDELQRR